MLFSFSVSVRAAIDSARSVSSPSGEGTNNNDSGSNTSLTRSIRCSSCSILYSRTVFSALSAWQRSSCGKTPLGKLALRRACNWLVRLLRPLILRLIVRFVDYWVFSLMSKGAQM